MSTIVRSFVRTFGRVSLLIGFLCFATASFARGLDGTYALYRSDNPSKFVTNMTIYNQSAGSFLIRGDGWSGSGSVNGGYYDWSFGNGTTGRTTFRIRGDGTLFGHVQSSSGRIINWSYIAKPTSRPAASAQPPSQPSAPAAAARAAGGVAPSGNPRKMDDGFSYWNFKNGSDTACQVSVCVEYANGVSNIQGATVPARGSADVSLGASSLRVVKLTWQVGGKINCPSD